MGKHYLPRQKQQLRAFLVNFSTKIAVHGPALNVTPAEITQIQTNCAWAVAAIDLQTDGLKYAQGLSRFLDAVLYATEAVTAWPNDFTKPMTMPTVGQAGVIPLITLLVKRVKGQPGYTKEMGEELGIEGAESAMAPMDVNDIKPTLKVVLAAGGHPNVIWKKKTFDSIELWVDRGDGKGFVFLAVDSVPDYLDTFALPAPGMSAVWKYKGIYRISDEQVGQWSDEVKVGVMGQV